MNETRDTCYPAGRGDAVSISDAKRFPNRPPKVQSTRFGFHFPRMINYKL